MTKVWLRRLQLREIKVIKVARVMQELLGWANKGQRGQ